MTIAALVTVIAAMTLATAQPAAAQTYTVLHDFTGGVDGAFPHQMTLGSDGNFYGTSTWGGANGQGNIYRMDPSGAFTVLYSFVGGTEGSEPEGPVFRDTDGNLYGTTREGGDPHCRCGIFFKLDKNNVLTILHTFTKGADGEFPSNNLVSVSGELYGVTEAGEDGPVLYKITKTGGYTVLHSFGLTTTPDSQGDLTRDSAGNIYGEVSDSIFELDTAGNFSTVYTFTDGANDGAGPLGRLLVGAGDTITGAAQSSPGNVECSGEAFRLASDGTVTALHHFFGGASGCSPQTGLVDMGATLYGTTAYGGDLSCRLFNGEEGCGLLYQIDGTGKYAVIHRFGGSDGAWPQDELTKGNDGSIYGITKIGGTGRLCDNVAVVLGCGVIFKYTP
jgi:uncharacterized repeat protein (TIGR03803 family)